MGGPCHNLTGLFHITSVGRKQNVLLLVLIVESNFSRSPPTLNHMTSAAILRRLISPTPSRVIGRFRSLTSCESVTNCGVGANESITPARLRLPPLLEFQDGDTQVVGWSDDWVALFNKRKNDLFLSDFVSRRRIKLPPIHTLPDPEFNLDLDGHGSVSKVVLSSSPEDDDCRAMMTFGPGNRLAFCLPGRSSEWTPIGEHFYDFDHHEPFESVALVHEDLVYCAGRRVFTSITPVYLDLRSFSLEHVENRIESVCCEWDVQDPHRPKLVRSNELFVRKRHRGEDEDDDDDDEDVICVKQWVYENREVLEKECVQIPHLVYEEQCDELYMVIQFVRLMKEDGESESPLGYVPTCELNGLDIDGVVPGKTFGFIVFSMDNDYGDECLYCTGSRKCTLLTDVGGDTMFVGMNNSAAIPPPSSSDDDDGGGDDEKFKPMPNAIYFTDSKRLKRLCCLNDNGVFDYATKTISPLSLSYSYRAPN